jgi:hypothetical protein
MLGGVVESLVQETQQMRASAETLHGQPDAAGGPLFGVV